MSRSHTDSPGFALDPIVWPSAGAIYLAWLRLGVVAVLLLPDARLSHALLGWLPFWLLGVPALALLQQRLMRPRSAQSAGTPAGASSSARSGASRSP
jgi:hypothetical protein